MTEKTKTNENDPKAEAKETPVEKPEAKKTDASKPEAKPALKQKAQLGADNTVFVGKKGTMAYVLAVVTQFNGGAKEVTVKARGRAISRAVDVAEIVKHRFVSEVKIGDISTTTEEVTSSDGKTLKVSAIEIKLNK